MIPAVGVLCLLAALRPTESPRRPPAAPTMMVDEACRSAIDRLYDGSTDTALDQLRRLAADRPDDSLVLYFQALALAWKIEQRPDTTELDLDLQRLVDRILVLTEHPLDARARLARGGALGVRSRLQVFRMKSRDAARAASAMRDTLLPLRGHDVYGPDAEFGIGLYEYYVDVLPRVARILRFFSGLPGGDRKQGLAAIERAKEHSVFHCVEAGAQLYEIYAFYEHEPDLALAEIRQLHEHHPGSPLWALKLTEHLRDRLGRYSESAAVARAVVIAARRGDENFGPAAGALGRLAQGEALLLDLRLDEARRTLLDAREGLPAALLPRVRLFLGQTLELEGDRAAAEAHYRAAALSQESEVRRAAETALSRPRTTAEIEAMLHLAEGRRFREAGRFRESVEAHREALRWFGHSDEARLRVAEDDLRNGRLDLARSALAALEDLAQPSPPWIRPWTWLLRGYLDDLEGRRPAAVEQYNKVLKTPYGDPELVRETTERLQHPFRADAPPEPPSSSPHHSK
jgi:tetratricopeptide (TPR) repeat protein